MLGTLDVAMAPIKYVILSIYKHSRAEVLFSLTMHALAMKSKSGSATAYLELVVHA